MSSITSISGCGSAPESVAPDQAIRSPIVESQTKVKPGRTSKSRVDTGPVSARELHREREKAKEEAEAKEKSNSDG